MADEHAKEQPIIVIKKISGHGGHHGGAWKVAYADFVTAMMALFMVLWLLNASQETQKAIGGYFQDPEGNGKLIGSDMAGAGGESIDLAAKDMEKLKEKISQSLKESSKFKELEDKIVMVVTGEGLRIELLESDTGTFFESGSPVPTAQATEIIGKLAQEAGKLPNKLTIEGHTDSKRFAGDYSNWELSADRANTARRIMQVHGVREDQCIQIRGFADQTLRKKEDPSDPSNRRISIIIHHLEGPKKKPADKAAKAEGGHGEEKKADAHGEEKKADSKGDSHGAEKKADSHGDSHGAEKKPAAH
ncbi:MAG: flagellar motor protein MotB [Acidobacteria bacterium]|nr:flagellar motor protein MotB [Acidobacteriota bacterium]